MDELEMKIMIFPTSNGSIRGHRTVYNYIANLKLLYKKINNTNWNYDMKYYTENVELVIKTLREQYKLGTSNNYLSAIIVALKATDNDVDNKYIDEMNSNGERIRSNMLLQTKNIKENKNWTSIKELQLHVKNMKKMLSIRGVFKKSYEQLTPFERNLLRDWMVACLYVLDPENPPLRSDYVMKVITSEEYKTVDKNLNYLVVKGRNNKFFHLGDYKTKKTYGDKMIKVGKKLNTALNEYLKVHNKEYLLYTPRGLPVDGISLAKLVPSAFQMMNKHITINLLRHIFITELLPEGGPNLMEKEKVADAMCHSTAIQEQYKKLE